MGAVLLQGLRLKEDLIGVVELVPRPAEGSGQPTRRARAPTSPRPSGIEAATLTTGLGHRRGEDQEARGPPHAVAERQETVVVTPRRSQVSVRPQTDTAGP